MTNTYNLNKCLHDLSSTQFNNDDIINTINTIETILNENIKMNDKNDGNNYNDGNDHDDYTIYYSAFTMLGYYYGKTHNYEKSLFWLSKAFDLNFKPLNDNTWDVFSKIIFPLIPKDYNEEVKTISKLNNDLDTLLATPNLQIKNLLILDHSFWYGYLDTNPKHILEKYANLQLKLFSSITHLQNNKFIKNTTKLNKIRIGIVSAGLIPQSQINISSIHSSSISDSFYPTLLRLSKDKFDIFFIYYNKTKPTVSLNTDTNSNTDANSNTDSDNNIYISNELKDLDSIHKAQSQIINLKLDILLYLELHIEPMINYLALSKLAPIQMCTHGHPVTSGILRPIMNYYISWDSAEIDNAQEHYTEKLILLPKDTIWEYYIPRNNDGTSLLTGKRWAHIKREDMTFLPNTCDINKNWYFCAQSCFKFHNTFIDILKNILEKDKNSLIILIKNKKETYSLDERLLSSFKNNNIELHRIILIDKMKHHNMMSVYKNCDVVLDSYFFGGDTTSREAFEIGAPIITLPHKYLGSRWTQAYYKHMGFTDLIVKNTDDYVSKAIQVANDKHYSKQIRETILQNVHKLFYNNNAVKGWEDMFNTLYLSHYNEKDTYEDINIDNNNDNDNDNTNTNTNTNNCIPKIIIQTWKDNTIPKSCINYIHKLKQLHKDYDYMFFTDSDIEDFIKLQFPNYYDIYNNFKYTIQKIDFFRYLAIYYYGGFYFDIDMNINYSIDKLCIYECVFPKEYDTIIKDKLLLNQHMNFLIGNYAFGASKKNKFIKLCIDNIVNDRIPIDTIPGKGTIKETYVLYTTGPVMVSQSYIDFQFKNNIKIIEPSVFKPNSFGNYGNHVMIGSWTNKPKGGTELMIERISNHLDLTTINIITELNTTKLNKNELNTTELNTTELNKTIFYCHDLPGDVGKTKGIENFNNIVFVSNYQKNLFVNKYSIPTHHYTVIPNGIYPIKPHKKNKSVCRIIYHTTPHRGLDILVEVFSKLVPILDAQCKSVHLDVYSSFNIYNRPDLDEYYQDLFNKIKKHTHMTYHGTVSNDEIREALQKAHIFAYPSTFEETSCLSLIEAMSAKCICVHSSLGALPDTANNHTMMYNYTPNKFEHCTRFAETFLKAIQRFYNNNNDNNNDAELIKMKIHADTQFNIENTIKLWKTYITQLKKKTKTNGSETILFTIINDKHDIEKKDFMKLQCDNIGLNYSFFDTIDGLTYKLTDKDNHYLNKKSSACFLSHIEVIKKFLNDNDNDNDYIIICEDDMIFTDITIETVIKNIINTINLETTGIIYLGLSKLNKPDTKELFSIDNRYKLYECNKMMNQGAMSYLITKNVAKQLLHHYNNGCISESIDQFYINYIKNSYIVYPPLLIHNNVCNSLIDKKEDN